MTATATQPTAKQLQAVYLLTQAILEAVEVAGPDGAPAGVLYAALMGYIKLDQFERIAARLVELGYLTKRGHLYFRTEKKLGITVTPQ